MACSAASTGKHREPHPKLRDASDPPERQGFDCVCLGLDKITRIMTEKRHERLKTHARVCQLGGIGVAELVGSDVQDDPVRPGEPGRLDGVAQSLANSPRPKTPAMLGEEVVDRLPGLRMDVSTLGAALSGPGVERGDGFSVERDRAFGAELAERDVEPGAGRAVVDDAG